MPRGPLADAVEGLARDQEVLEQEQQPRGRRDAGSAVLAGEVVAEDGLEAEPVEESVEDRQDTDGGGVESPAGGAGGPSGPKRWRGLMTGMPRLLIHERISRCVLVSTAGAADRSPVPPP